MAGEALRVVNLATRNPFMQEAKVDVSMLNEGHKKAIVQMYANGARIPDLASWYKVSQAVIREVLKPHIRFG